MGLRSWYNSRQRKLSEAARLAQEQAERPKFKQVLRNLQSIATMHQTGMEIFPEESPKKKKVQRSGSEASVKIEDTADEESRPEAQGARGKSITGYQGQSCSPSPRSPLLLSRKRKQRSR